MVPQSVPEVAQLNRGLTLPAAAGPQVPSAAPVCLSPAEHASQTLSQARSQQKLSTQKPLLQPADETQAVPVPTMGAQLPASQK